MQASKATGTMINAERLWTSLMDLARVGGTPKGGVRRITLTDADRQGRDLFVRWARDTGLTVRTDEVGNIFARRPGSDPAALPVVIGSHLDTQPSGGKFDGAYGVMAGLEVTRTLNDHGIATRAPIEVVSWTNEEGSRFVPVMMGSGVFAGVFRAEQVLAAKDSDGISAGDALKGIGYAGDGPAHAIDAYFEAHIEQGPVLEDTRTTIGVVQGALGQRWFDVRFSGQDAHAGPTPMDLRHDALIAASHLVLEVNRIARTYPDYARGTVGHMQVKPNSRNVVPGEVQMSVDLRNADDATLRAMADDLTTTARRLAADCRVEAETREVVYFPPCRFARDLVDSVRESAQALGLGHRDIVSGAAHDAVYLARVAPTAMIFVPCEGGISHNELESARPEDLAAGCNVLLRAILERAGAREPDAR
ncbi:MAG TPA: Zn-dependent hydrolase [Casimicrobiaceae bacterium]|nr:Zn-dependent hydrolase [Casimicrobiaceae bacterium]